MAKRSASLRSDPGSPPDFVDAVLEIVDSIPPGHVMTYGDVAAALGSRGARMVGQIMARYGDRVPWWRVVRAGGLPPVEHERAALERYRAEATPLRWPTSRQTGGDAFESYRIELADALWWPLGSDQLGSDQLGSDQ